MSLSWYECCVCDSVSGWTFAEHTIKSHYHCRHLSTLTTSMAALICISRCPSSLQLFFSTFSHLVFNFLSLASLKVSLTIVHTKLVVVKQVKLITFHVDQWMFIISYIRSIVTVLSKSRYSFIAYLDQTECRIITAQGLALLTPRLTCISESDVSRRAI